MKSDKQRILEAYSEDLKAMNTNPEDKASDVKKWIVKKPTYITEQHNIVDAYAILAENDNMRSNKMRILNDQILHEAKLSRLKEVIDEAKAEMKRYAEGSDFENSSRFVEARDKFDEATALYKNITEDDDEEDEDHEDMDEGEGLKPAPSPEKHDATGSTEGGDTTVGDVETSEIDDELDTVKEDHDEEDDEDHMDEADEYDVPSPETHDTGSTDGGVVTKTDLTEEDDYKRELNDIKENKDAYMKYAKGIIGDRDLSKMPDEETKELFNKIDAGWNSKDEEGEDGAK